MSAHNGYQCDSCSAAAALTFTAIDGLCVTVRALGCGLVRQSNYAQSPRNDDGKDLTPASEPGAVQTKLSGPAGERTIPHFLRRLLRLDLHTIRPNTAGAKVVQF